MERSGVEKQNTERGAILFVVTVLILLGSMLVVAGIIVVVRTHVQVVTEQYLALDTYMFAEGALEEVVYRHKTALQVSPTETLSEGALVTNTVTTNVPGGKTVRSDASLVGRTRALEAELIEGDGVSFSFGVQTHNGGLIMENSSSVNGNVYSNGPIIGHNLNLIRGTAISAGPSGSITEVHATGSMYAHDISDSYVEDDAYYQTIDILTTVDGTRYPGSPDLATTSLPIDDALLDSWAAFAASSSVMSAECAAAGGTLVFDADVTLGPVKIPCDVVFEKFPTVTVAGVIWVEGNLEFTQGPEFEIHPAIGNKSVPIIVDDPGDRLTSGQVTMKNSGAWSGNGDRSYIMVVSRNESAELGGTEHAIQIQNSTGGALLVYAGHGEINLQNNTDLTEITAWRVRLENLTEVIYDTGLASAVFTAGPGGSYIIDSWREVE